MTFSAIYKFQCDGCDAETPEADVTDDDVLQSILHEPNWMRVEVVKLVRKNDLKIEVRHFCPNCRKKVEFILEQRSAARA